MSHCKGCRGEYVDEQCLDEIPCPGLDVPAQLDRLLARDDKAKKMADFLRYLWPQQVKRWEEAGP